MEMSREYQGRTHAPARASSTCIAARTPAVASWRVATYGMPTGEPLALYLLHVEHTLQQPCDLDTFQSPFGTNGRLERVPVLHAFGAMRDGTRCCVHIHNVFPYCYVEYRGALDEHAVQAYTKRLARALNAALATSLPPSLVQPQHQYIAAIHLCKAKLFYGYHDRWSYFLKISYTNPALRTRLSAFLEQGRAMHTFQPYEAHVQYHLQWMLDYKVFGCDWVFFEHAISLSRCTSCRVEVHAQAHDILNRRVNHASVSQASQSSFQDDPVVPSLRALWKQYRERRAQFDMGPPPSLTDERSVDASDRAWDATSRMLCQWEDRVRQAHAGPASPPPLDAHVPVAYDTVELFHKTRASSAHVEICSSSTLTPSSLVVPSTLSMNSSAPISTPRPRIKSRRATSSLYLFHAPPLSCAELDQTWSQHSLLPIEYQACHYTSTADVPRHHGFSTALDGLEAFRGRSPRLSRAVGRIPRWQWAHAPPSHAQVSAWLAPERSTQPMILATPNSQESGPSEKKFLSTLCIEVLVHTQGDHVPDPQHDPISCIAYTWMEEADDSATGYVYSSGVLLVSEEHVKLALPILTVPSERALFDALISLVRSWDPDILAGYDVSRSSWGLLANRAQAAHGIDMAQELGRMYGVKDYCGRSLLNVWRLMSTHIALSQYTLEHVVLHVLHERSPVYSWATTAAWMQSRQATDRERALSYALRRVKYCALLLAKTEVLLRTAEFARMYGVDFFSVLSRGSQFRVESVVLRITKPRSFMLPSPSRAQVGRQNAPECIPLVMEPLANMYHSPVIVLDFQSLYPSIMMAYNICYSTCLGRIAPFKGTYKLGFTDYTPDEHTLRALRDDVYLLPNGLAFVKPHIREGVLPRMLREVLSARVMTKHTLRVMHMHRGMQKRLQAQQLALKLLANVTYGYCGATFSGRMPCVEIADSIVQAGRETLEHAMSLVERTPEWGAELVYGDTDSLFVHVPGRSKYDAFRIGREIAERVSALHPAPVLLRLEKVYQPSLLVSKKRYAGYRFDSPQQARAVLDVKGLEMIRRDGHAVQRRLQEACIRLLFETRDLSAVKRYCQRQWAKLYAGQISPHLLIISRQVRLVYASQASLPPGAVVAMRQHRLFGLAPHDGERVPYLIVHGAPASKLQDLAIAPSELSTYSLHMEYYVQRTILPVLDRILGLVGVNVYAWHDAMPRTSNTRASWSLAPSCHVCGYNGPDDICVDCLRNPETSMYRATCALYAAEARQLGLYSMCTTCAHTKEQPPCKAYDCALLYARAEQERRIRVLSTLPARLEKAWLADPDELPQSDAWTW